MLTTAASQDARSAVLLADIAVVLVAGLVLGRLARWLRQPVVIGEIVAGIVLGPSLLGRLPGDPTQVLFPADVRPLLSAVSQIGLVLFMFVVGWEFEKQLVRPHAGLAAKVSLLSVAVAFGTGIGLAALIHPAHATVAGREIPFGAFALFMGTALSVTAFPVLARILTDRKLMSTRVGSLALACAAVDDVLAWYLLAFVSALVKADGDHLALLRVGALSLCYVALMLFAVRPLLARLVRLPAALADRPALLTAVCAGVLLSAWVTSWIGLHAIFGAFLFGFVMPREPDLARKLRTPVEQISRIFLPVFFIVTGLGVDLGALGTGGYLMLVSAVGAACAGKLIGTMIPARLSGLSWTEAWDLGVLMNTRGLTELVVLNAGVSMGVLDGTVFTVLVITALVTTAMAGPLLSARAVDPPAGRLSSPERSPAAGSRRT
ncbi:cation:proton antiporter [Streptomyces sp. OK228]|uniref:cation:proton antiporter n=1 Tax=Streptomyces sp. OK228 TaxID=1882786 RepID=UPI000BD5BEE4|nr:cation:proton antiporter [Streptomyces sp. OK228]SOE32338.1 Kef-type K+ transport system, membrane component KefB [Streptomyces sp. OK228]